MCGICGAIRFDDPREAESVVRRMNAALIHRGPNDEGVLVGRRAAFGMRRLSIIDLPGGGQPVWNESETMAVVFNGEIYNFRELRRLLEGAGHQFRTHSDTEVIVHAYETWGAGCVSRLRGMFAFAIAEMPAGREGEVSRVFIARDRLGIKPLYFASAEGRLLFASEVRALLASRLIVPSISPQAVSSYVCFGSVGEPMTLIDGIFSLPPGHSLTIDTNSPVTAIEPKPYWCLDTVKASPPASNGTCDLAPARLRSLLDDSVQKHLIADVPIGIFLSSGIDSTALTALASQTHAGLRTISLVFPEREFSEAEIARRTAKRFRTDHREVLLSGEDMLDRMDEAIAGFDQPSMDGINTYFVSWAARQAGLKVVLSGLGSDEIFGGYSTFRATPQLTSLARFARSVPPQIRRATSPIAGFLGSRLRHADAGRKLAAAWRDPALFANPSFYTRLLFDPAQAAELLSDGINAWRESPWRTWIDGVSQEAMSIDGASRVSWLELRSYMANVLLRDADAMSMRHSLELRVPFLDHPVVEFALGLSDSQKRHTKRPKALLIAALGGLLPEEVVTQRKRTFTLPWEKWLRGPLRARLAAGISNWAPSLAPVISREAAQRVWNNFLLGQTSWSHVWSLHVLNEWVGNVLDVSADTAAMQVALATDPGTTHLTRLT
jgi:asparagine synthase (glutamine-hydrolysing)